MTLALKMASSMCFSSDLMTHLMLLTTCWTSGGRLQLECSRNLATNIFVSLYIFRSARECGRSCGECVYGGRGLRWISSFLPSFCCFAKGARGGLAPTTSAEMSLGSKKGNKINLWKPLLAKGLSRASGTTASLSGMKTTGYRVVILYSRQWEQLKNILLQPHPCALYRLITQCINEANNTRGGARLYFSRGDPGVANTFYMRHIHIKKSKLDLIIKDAHHS